MKKIALILMACLLLMGCTHKQNISTFMIQNDQKLHAMYNNKGDQLTDFSYKDYQEMDGYGYIVKNDKDQLGFIDEDGDVVIPFGTYESMTIVCDMLYAKKKVNKDEPPKDGYDYDNVYLLKGNGEILYEASKDVGIYALQDQKVNPYFDHQLPIIKKDNEFIVLYKNGIELMSGQDIVSAYQYEDGQYVTVNYKDYGVLYDYHDYEAGKETELPVGDFVIVGVDPLKHETAIVYDFKQKVFAGVDLVNCQSYLEKFELTDCEYDFSNNIILKQKGKVFTYIVGKKPIEMNSYYLNGQQYLIHMSNVYGPHKIYNEDKVIEIGDCQLYPQPQLIVRDIYPVYVKKKGFVYYNLKGEIAIKDVYLDAEPFDMNGNAIVKKDQSGYSLIDETGKIKTTKTYTRIELLGGSYYAAYSKSGRYCIIDASGKEVLESVYTTLPKSAYILYHNKEYLLLNKNGRSFLYDIEDDMEELESIEGSLEFNEKGYLTDGTHYYTFNGELIR